MDPDAEAAVAGEPGGRIGLLDERRLVRLAAAASRNAAVTPRLEIYPRDLDAVRALRLAQAGLVSPRPGLERSRQLDEAQVRARVRTRFPELAAELPPRPALDTALREAGFELDWSPQHRCYELSGHLLASITVTSLATGGAGRGPTALGAYRYLADRPELAQAAAAEQRLAGAADGDGFRALSVRRTLTVPAAHRLAARFGAEPLNVAAVFLAALHEQVDPRPLPTWETVLAADAAPPGTRAARKISEYVEAAWAAARLRLLAAIRRDPVPAPPGRCCWSTPVRSGGTGASTCSTRWPSWPGPGSGRRGCCARRRTRGSSPGSTGRSSRCRRRTSGSACPTPGCGGEHRDAIGDLGA